VLVCAFPEHTRVSAQQRLIDCSRDFFFFPFQVHPTDSAHSLLIVSVLPTRHLFGPC
jgi:hypothetical protein